MSTHILYILHTYIYRDNNNICNYVCMFLRSVGKCVYRTHAAACIVHLVIEENATTEWMSKLIWMNNGKHCTTATTAVIVNAKISLSIYQNKKWTRVRLTAIRSKYSSFAYVRKKRKVSGKRQSILQFFSLKKGIRFTLTKSHNKCTTQSKNGNGEEVSNWHYIKEKKVHTLLS